MIIQFFVSQLEFIEKQQFINRNLLFYIKNVKIYMKNSDQQSQGNKSNRACKFIQNLYDIIQNSQFQNIISWSPNGKSFIIHNLKAFQQEILPIYFKHKNFTSFIRQLNMYNFIRKKTSQQKKQYIHKYFSRNQEVLLKCIIRKKEQKSKKPKNKKQKKSNKIMKSEDRLTHQVHELISFNRKLLQQNSMLWQLFFQKSGRQQQQNKKNLNNNNDLTDQLQQLINYTHEIETKFSQQAEQKNEKQFNFDELLKQYKIISDIVDSTIDGQML